MKDIKELSEVLDAMELMVMTAAKVMKDGKIRLNDLLVLKDLLGEYKVVYKAFKGLKEIPTEIKDLDSSEIMQLGQRVLELVAKIKGEFEQREEEEE